MIISHSSTFLMPQNVRSLNDMVDISSFACSKSSLSSQFRAGRNNFMYKKNTSTAQVMLTHGHLWFQINGSSISVGIFWHRFLCSWNLHWREILNIRSSVWSVMWSAFKSYIAMKLNKPVELNDCGGVPPVASSVFRYLALKQVHDQ